MSEQQVIERTEEGTTIHTGTDGQRMKIPHTLPILPIRNIVVFPGTVMPLNIGRAKSKALLEEVMPGDKLIGVLTQRNSDSEDPNIEDLYQVGVAANVLAAGLDRQVDAVVERGEIERTRPGIVHEHERPVLANAGDLLIEARPAAAGVELRG